MEDGCVCLARRGTRMKKGEKRVYRSGRRNRKLCTRRGRSGEKSGRRKDENKEEEE